MILLAVDPGTTESAWVRFFDGAPTQFGTIPNEEMLSFLRDEQQCSRHLAIEMLASYGMPVGAEVFETAVWIGRFIEAWGGPFTKVYRKDVKLHLCQSPRAADPNVRQAIIDKYGGKANAIGKKKTQGPLYGVSGDVWAALAVAITWSETIGAKA